VRSRSEVDGFSVEYRDLSAEDFQASNRTMRA
jgi:hypothetical protein